MQGHALAVMQVTMIVAKMTTMVSVMIEIVARAVATGLVIASGDRDFLT